MSRSVLERRIEVSVLVVAATEREAAHVPGRLDVVLTGVGKVEAAVATARAITEHRPSRLINVGTAGALRPGVSGIFLPSRVLNHDLDSAAIRRLQHEPVDEICLDDGDGTVLATGDSFITDTAVRDRLARDASLVDMEGFAVARVAETFGVPAQLVKIVSDEADDTALDWLEVVDQCARELGQWLDHHL